MKAYFKSKINRVALISVLLVVVLSLVSCRGGKWNSTVYTTWAAEFKFSSFFQGFFGWPVAILSYPIAWLMYHIGKVCDNSYAWGLILTTLIVRTIAWPIYAKQNSSSVKMQLIQPEMERIQRKYGNRKDPESQRRMQAETMALYKKYKINPLGCMFTMIIQFPIFMGMYEAVRRINLTSTTVLDGGASVIVQPGKFALTNTKMFNVFELSKGFSTGDTKTKIFTLIVALLFSGVTLLSQYLASKKPKYLKDRPRQINNDQTQKQMKMMSYFMVVMFFIMSLRSTSLAVYWLVGGLYQLLQSYIGRKMNEREYYKMQGNNSIINSKDVK